MLTCMLVSLPTGCTLGDVGISLSSTSPSDFCCWAEDARRQISLITKFISSSFSEASSPSLHSCSGLWTWQSFWSKYGRWSSSMEMILGRCPLVSARLKRWPEPLARFCLTELGVSSSSSSLVIQSTIIAHTTVLMGTTQIQHRNRTSTAQTVAV